MTTTDAALRAAARNVIHCWDRYFGAPSIANHSRLRDAITELGCVSHTDSDVGQRQ